MVREIRVTSWNELTDCLYDSSWQEELRRFRSPFAFRGISDTAHDLTTSLQRMGTRFEEVEAHLLRNFRKYASQHVMSRDSVWNWLAIAQHHGLPTRLLDWTYSPFVALHFATYNPDLADRDGAIWCVDHVKSHKLLPVPLRAVLDQEGSDVFTVELLDQVSPTLRAFDDLGEDDFIIFLEPPSLDARIINQFALFSVMSSPTVHLADWLDRNPDLAFKVIIPAALKWEVRDKLDQANVTERVLFPGLDGLSRWLRRYYLTNPSMPPTTGPSSTAGSCHTDSRAARRPPPPLEPRSPAR